MMTSEDEERVLSAVQKTVKFYNKPWDDLTRQFWRQWVRQQRDADVVLDALRLYPNTGRFCPKPADIYTIMLENKPSRSNYSEPEIVDTCPPEIRKAWSYWIPQFWGDPLPFNDTDKDEEVDEGQAEAWLILINQEAKKLNVPDSIPDTHKLQEIWT